MLILDIKVVPSAGKQRCCLDNTKHLKCYLKSAPERGKANAELISLFSKKLKIPKTSIKIVLGATSRKKRLQIDTELSFESVCENIE